ncbi:MAG: hypothetical protein AAF502_06265 [Bacteroidota bacterium]
MIPHAEMQQYVDKINSKFSVHALWDGYYIRMFKRRNLVIGGSQDWIYYHNIDIIFKKVIFFNLPSYWQDACIEGEDLFRLTTHEELILHHPDFNPLDRHVFAIDLDFDYLGKGDKHTYFIVAANVFYERHDPPGDGLLYYEDPLGKVGIYNKNNRVIKVKPQSDQGT